MSKISDEQLACICGGLSFQTHIRAFTEANWRWTKIVNKYGRVEGAKRPDALKYERLMKMIDAFPFPYEKSI